MGWPVGSEEEGWNRNFDFNTFRTDLPPIRRILVFVYRAYIGEIRERKDEVIELLEQTSKLYPKLPEMLQNLSIQPEPLLLLMMVECAIKDTKEAYMRASDLEEKDEWELREILLTELKMRLLRLIFKQTVKTITFDILCGVEWPEGLKPHDFNALGLKASLSIPDRLIFYGIPHGFTDEGITVLEDDYEAAQKILLEYREELLEQAQHIAELRRKGDLGILFLDSFFELARSAYQSRHDEEQQDEGRGHQT